MEINEKYLKDALSLDNDKTKRILLMYDIAKIISNKNKNDLLLKGGTALLFCYGLPRYSTDLDYDGFNYNVDIINDIKSVFKTNNLELENINTKKDTDTTKRFMIHYKEAKNKPLKLEISFRNIDNIDNIKNYFVQINGINTYNIKYLSFSKINAFIERTAARDIFDTSFILQNFPESVNKDLIEKCDKKIKSFGLNHLENKFKSDEILNNFDCDTILIDLENNVKKCLSKYNSVENNANNYSRSR